MMLNKIIYFLMLATAFLLPIFYLERSLVPLFLVPIIFLLGLIRAYQEKQFIFKRTPLDYALLAFLGIAFLSVYFSLDRYASFWSLAPITALAMFFWLVLSHLEKKQIKKLLGVLVLSGFIASSLFLLALFFKNFRFPNLLGSLSSLSAYLGLTSTLSFYFILKSKNWFIKFLHLLNLALALLIVSIINFSLGWNILIAASVLWLVVLLAEKKRQNYGSWIVLPIIILSLAITWKFFDFGPVYNLDLPIEVSLGREASFNIARSAVHQDFGNILLGTGPGTFSYNFSRYKDQEFNQNPLWSYRFSQANNQFLETWNSSGYLGFLSLLFLLGLGLVIAWESRLLLPVFGVLLLISWYSVWGLVFWLGFFLLIAFTISSDSLPEIKIKLGSSLFTSLAFVLGIIIVVVFLGYLTKIYLADYYLSRNNISWAIKYNPNQAWYYVALADNSLVKAQELLNAEAKLEATQLQSEVANLVAQAINSSQKAVELSPNNVAIWQARAEIFKQARNYAADANQWVISTLEEAIKLEPVNPNFYRDLGVAYEIAQDQENALASLEKAVELKSNLAVSQYELGRFLYNQDELDQAINHLGNAVYLAPDYANALFSLSLAFEKKGDQESALLLMKRVQELNPENQTVQEKVKNLTE